METAKTIICELCSSVAPRRGTGRQRYCVPCSEKKAMERCLPASYWIAKKSKLVEKGKEISKLIAQRAVFDIPEMPINNGFSIYFCIPFSQGASKNNIYSLARGGSHIFKRGQTRKFQDDLILIVKKAVNESKIKVYHNKVWISLFVQKPHHKSDAINVVDVICDAIKKAIDLDDRWFCIRGLDWEIAKNDPQIFVGIHQPDRFDAMICSHCGRLMTLDNFSNKKGTRLGKDRVCNDCRRP